MSRPVLLIDNLDSFSFNLVDSFERLGAEVRVLRNTVAASAAFNLAVRRNALIVISPGPGDPHSAGCCIELVGLAKGKVPLLGICLGHQALVAEAGGTVSRAPEPIHGKACPIAHDGTGPFAGLPNPLKVARYHSLAATAVPARLSVIATCGDVAMAVADQGARQVGLQFHPESILTPCGDQILANILTSI